MPLIAVTTGEVSCGGWLGVRVVGRLFAAFVDPDRPDAGFFDAVDRLPADRADPSRRRGSRHGPMRLRDGASRIESRRAE